MMVGNDQKTENGSDGIAMDMILIKTVQHRDTEAQS